MKKMMITKAAAVLAAGLLAFGLTACGENDTTENTQDTTTENTTNTENTDTENTDNSATVDGTAITIEVVDAEGNTTSFEGVTDAEFLLDAIEDIEGVTVDGYTADWGYYVTTVNGIEADYDTTGAYWSISVNGEYGQYGIDTQPVTAGDVYTLTYVTYEGKGDDLISFTIEVTDNEGNTTSYTGYTYDEFLFDALDDVEGFTYDGVEESWGYNVTTINGLLADYNTDGAYWALYVNGEYGQNGVQTQPVEEGAVYGFVYDASAAAN